MHRTGEHRVPLDDAGFGQVSRHVRDDAFAGIWPIVEKLPRLSGELDRVLIVALSSSGQPGIVAIGRCPDHPDHGPEPLDAHEIAETLQYIYDVAKGAGMFRDEEER